MKHPVEHYARNTFYNDVVFPSSKVSDGAKRCILVTMIPLLAVIIAVGCSRSEPIESAAQMTGENVTQRSADGAEVVATTSGGPAEREATTGVASTTGQTEASASGTSASKIPTSPPTASPVAPTRPTSKAKVAAPKEALFTAARQTGGGDGYGADGILAVRYGVHKGYERVVVDLGTGEEPAWAVPEWALSTPTGDGTLRVTLPSVSKTDVSDGTLNGSLLKNFHVVRGPESGMFVDIFSKSAFEYRVIELSNPSRLVVDFKPSSASLELPLPAESGNTVLTQPRGGARVDSSLTVSGYSRNPEATNTVTLTNAAGETIVQDTVMSNDWTTTWGYFETTLNVPNFSGEGTLKVGDRSARDGTFDGVEIPVYGS